MDMETNSDIEYNLAKIAKTTGKIASSSEKYLERIAEATEKTARWVDFFGAITVVGIGLGIITLLIFIFVL